MTARNSITDDQLDVERSAVQRERVLATVDIEHQPVVDDPRLWSPAFKW